MIVILRSEAMKDLESITDAWLRPNENAGTLSDDVIAMFLAFPDF